MCAKSRAQFKGRGIFVCVCVQRTRLLITIHCCCYRVILILLLLLLFHTTRTVRKTGYFYSPPLCLEQMFMFIYPRPIIFFTTCFMNIYRQYLFPEASCHDVFVCDNSNNNSQDGAVPTNKEEEGDIFSLYFIWHFIYREEGGPQKPLASNLKIYPLLLYPLSAMLRKKVICLFLPLLLPLGTFCSPPSSPPSLRNSRCST